MPAATRQRAWSPLVTFLAWTLAGAPVSAVVAPPRPVHTPAASVGESAGAELADENGPVPQAGGERLPPGLLYGLSTGGPGENEFLSDGTLANDPSRLGKAQARKSLCLRGRGFLVALRVAFADRRGRVERAAHDSLLFGADRSLRRYFWEASEGELEVTGSVLPRDGSWFTLHWPMASYGSDTGPNNSDPTCRDRGVFSPMDFVRAAVECADPAVDFSLYDGNGDGSVDYLLIIHAGDDQATSQRPEDLWSRHLVLDDPLVTDGVRIESAMIVAETSPLGTLCHEFAHELGAPDLYESPSRSSLCLMGTGCWNGDPPGTEPAMLSAYLRWDIDG
ncbi:MAG: immune inhibitor A, partial [candidate division KSB1 bacterium]|nr:immune inhibitor A [candidate division KSB1 bacterium]